MGLINLDIPTRIGWSSDFRLATVLERIWQLLKEPNMAQIHPDAMTAFHVYGMIGQYLSTLQGYGQRK